MSEDLRCFGWSARAWARPWHAVVQQHLSQHLPPTQRLPSALELGAGTQSALAPLMLHFADQVECSALHGDTALHIKAQHAQWLPAAQQARITYTARDALSLEGQWDVIVMKSVLGGVCRTHASTLADVHALIARLVRDHLTCGGWLLSLDNGRTALEPLLQGFGARRNGWRFLARQDFPPATAHASFGVLGSFSAATRLGALGHGIDGVLYAADRVLSPLVRQHAVHVHGWQRVG